MLAVGTQASGKHNWIERPNPKNRSLVPMEQKALTAESGVAGNIFFCLWSEHNASDRLGSSAF
jgi:hypothetical protein